MTIPEQQPPLQNLVSYPDLFGDHLFLDHTKWHGVPVTLSTLVVDGHVVWIGTPPQQVIIGSRPRTDLELAGYYARWRVQAGLADVLEWLGERVIPMPPVTGAEVLDGIRRGLI
jgi:hypothetical protein